MISQNAYMHARLLAFMHPFHDAGGSGYQNAQALIALGSGGIWGKGLGQGTQKIFYLPESPSDMIAAVIGEELGLVGILVTALAFAGFAVLGFRIALRARDPFAKLLAAGVTCLVTGQAVVNLGRRAGLPPADGRPAAADKLRRLEPGRLHDPLRHPPQRGPGRTPPRPRDRLHPGCHQRTPPAIPNGERRC